MADRIIYCDYCDKRVGLIRDAKLIKGLTYICPTCRLLIKSKSRNQIKNKADFVNIFGDLLGKN
jgi:hypothetical protein